MYFIDGVCIFYVKRKIGLILNAQSYRFLFTQSSKVLFVAGFPLPQT